MTDDAGVRATLEEENRKLRVINDVLIRRVEREMDPAAASAFSLFYNTVATDSSVSERTTTLTNLAKRLVQEIAERKEAENALREAKAAAERANESKTNFLATITHDLRQPLHAARLYLGEAAQNAADARAAKLIHGVEVALDTMDDMLESLLDMARLDSGSWRVEPEIFAVAPMIARLVEEAAATARSGGIRLRWVPDATVVETDRRLLERILRNLIANALRYTERGGVLVGCRRRGGNIRIDVVDTGIGIARDKWQLIFDEFQQLAAPTRQAGKGLGLGLAVVDRAAKLIGARVELDSVPGRGSRFSITLPALPQHMAPPPQHDAPPQAGTPVNGIMMIIDDDASVRTALASLLTSWECQVIAVASTRAALDYVRRYGVTPSAVIADYHLQDGETGLVSIAALRGQCGQTLPALLMSADRGTGLRDLARQAGVLLLPKPLAPSKLRAVLTYLLAQAG